MKLVREHINEKFTEESNPIDDLGIGKFDIILKDYFAPYYDAYYKEYGEKISTSGMQRYFKKFKEEIEPIFYHRYVKGKIWKVNKGWKIEKIYVLKIMGLGMKTLFIPGRGLQYFHVEASDIHGKTQSYALYLTYKYEVTKR